MPTVLITGANRGLGLELARQYAGDGCRVIAGAGPRDSGKFFNHDGDGIPWSGPRRRRVDFGGKQGIIILR